MYPINSFLSSYEYQGWTGSLHYKLPHQGWKIHVSATFENYQSVLNHVAYLAQKLDFSFKFASSQKLIHKLLDVHGARESGGELITIYPKNKAHCLFLLKVLSNLLKIFPGPCVLSDKQFAETTNISYRYGVFENKSGEVFFYKGKTYEDKRLPYFNLPPFISIDPFAKYTISNISNDTHWKKIKIKGAYRFTLGGGIYYGTYLNSEPIVLKEGRFGIGVGNDQAVAKRQNECQILEKLQGKYFPMVLDDFITQGNYYLLLQKITGLTYYAYFASLGPVVVAKKLVGQSMSDFIKVIKNIISMVSYAHSKGIILRDINQTNVLVNTKTKKVYFVDCADSIFVGTHSHEKIKTPWYTIPEAKYNTYAEDWTKVAWLILDGLGGVNRNLCLANYTQVKDMFSKVLEYQGFSKKWGDIVAKLCTEEKADPDPEIAKLLLDPQLKKVRTSVNIPQSIETLNLDKAKLRECLSQVLSLKDQRLLVSLSQKTCPEVRKFIEKEQKKFITEDDMICLQNGSVYSPYVNGGAAGRLFVLLTLIDEFVLTDLLPQLEELLSKVSGRYVKNATLSVGAAGLGMLMLYTYALTKKERYLQSAYKWNELVDILSFSLAGRKAWSNYRFDARPDESFNNGNAGIRYFQRLLMGDKSYEFKKGDKC